MKTTAKVFIWIGMVANFYLIFPVIVGMNALNKLDTAKTKEELTTSAWLALVFCNLIGGICMLNIKDEELNEEKKQNENKTANAERQIEQEVAVQSIIDNNNSENKSNQEQIESNTVSKENEETMTALTILVVSLSLLILFVGVILLVNNL